MISHQLLAHKAVVELLPHINADQNLLFYSYVTQHKEKAQYIGQFINGQLTVVFAYFSGLSFPAFSFFRVEGKEIRFPELIAFTRETITLDEQAICGTILSQEDLELFQGFGLISGTPQRFQMMKHEDESKLLHSSTVTEVQESEYAEAVDFLQSGGMKFFTVDKLKRYPFLGIKQGNEFISMGGYHFYDAKLVEIGNILTKVEFRGRGLAKLLTSELTHLGKKRSPHIYLGVSIDNLPAIHIYKSLGYKRTKEVFIVNFTLSRLVSGLC
ncbi:GNAT family N-acetyltransferase [Paenibacillus sp. NPDC058071]|uniref:GNAT family N-acetyltransferase n=1 Tax=Paenibacillus sp. NPDC058071 TaxID=3346326 RepID=UPI0036DB7623